MATANRSRLVAVLGAGVPAAAAVVMFACMNAMSSST
jgi:hypothetical protein